MSRGKCPFFKKECIGEKCHLWTPLRGTHPQTGQPVDDYDCAIKWQVLLQVEANQKAISTNRAIESFRNEMATAGRGFLNLLIGARNRAIGRE